MRFSQQMIWRKNIKESMIKSVENLIKNEQQIMIEMILSKNEKSTV
jgi:hypothetical protein